MDKKCKCCNKDHNRNSDFCSVSCSNKSRVPWNKGLTKEIDKRCICAGHPAWNKGLTKHTDVRVAKNAIALAAGGNARGIASTPEKEAERKRKLSLKARQNNNGGYIPGSGRGKSGWYRDIWCDSSWELAYVIYCLDHNIKIERNRAKFEYIWNGKLRNYIPDFIVDGKLTEIKGYASPQWEAKLTSCPDVKVLYETDISPIIGYVKKKYGNKFVSLYENRKYSLTGAKPEVL
jgi:hypothetical protein